VEEAKKYNEAQLAKYEKSAFGGVDIWFILGLAVFVVPFGRCTRRAGSRSHPRSRKR